MCMTIVRHMVFWKDEHKKKTRSKVESNVDQTLHLCCPTDTTTDDRHRECAHAQKNPRTTLHTRNDLPTRRQVVPVHRAVSSARTRPTPPCAGTRARTKGPKQPPTGSVCRAFPTSCWPQNPGCRILHSAALHPPAPATGITNHKESNTGCQV